MKSQKDHSDAFVTSTTMWRCQRESYQSNACGRFKSSWIEARDQPEAVLRVKEVEVTRTSRTSRASWTESLFLIISICNQIYRSECWFGWWKYEVVVGHRREVLFSGLQSAGFFSGNPQCLGHLCLGWFFVGIVFRIESITDVTPRTLTEAPAHVSKSACNYDLEWFGGLTLESISSR